MSYIGTTIVGLLTLAIIAGVLVWARRHPTTAAVAADDIAAAAAKAEANLKSKGL